MGISHSPYENNHGGSFIRDSSISNFVSRDTKLRVRDMNESLHDNIRGGIPASFHGRSVSPGVSGSPYDGLNTGSFGAGNTSSELSSSNNIEKLKELLNMGADLKLNMDKYVTHSTTHVDELREVLHMADEVSRERNELMKFAEQFTSK